MLCLRLLTKVKKNNNILTPATLGRYKIIAKQFVYIIFALY